jgi:hypothetical protein
MPSLNNLLTKWKLWINRDHTFQADELKELQSHLMEEINYLVNREGLSEEEAFHKAVSLVGEREGLDQEYVKVKSAPNKMIHWVKVNPWSVCATLLILVIVSGYFALYRPIAQENISLQNDLGYIKTFKGPFKPLEGTDIFGQPINIPKLEWMKEIVDINTEDFSNRIFSISILPNGDVYTKNDIYSGYSSKFIDSITNYFSPNCNISWYRNSKDKEYFPTKNGVLTNTLESSYFRYSSSFVRWRKKGQDFVISPDKMLYNFSSKGLITSFDSTEKVRWHFQMPIKNINIGEGYSDYFFDNNANLHLIAYYHDKSSTMFTISSNGDLLNQVVLPKKMFPQNMMIYADDGSMEIINTEFLGNVFDDQIFLYKATDGENSSNLRIRSIDAFGFDGQQKWSYIEPELGQFKSKYVLDKNSTIYLTYRKQINKKVFLQSISSQGKLEWEREINSSSSTNPIVDNERNIYIGAQKRIDNKSKDTIPIIYCFAPDGSVKWIWEDKELINFSFHSDLVFGPKGSLYFAVTNNNDKLYCVKLVSSK